MENFVPESHQKMNVNALFHAKSTYVHLSSKPYRKSEVHAQSRFDMNILKANLQLTDENRSESFEYANTNATLTKKSAGIHSAQL